MVSYTYRMGIRPSSLSLCSAMGDEKEARPSPWDTTMGKDEPFMPSRKTDGLLCWIVTMLNRASNCWLVFSTNAGQLSDPGISSLSFETICRYQG